MKNITLLIVYITYYLLIQPSLIILAIDILFPYAIPFTFINVFATSFIYNILTEKVRISLRK
jgi:hypothetical protein